MLFESSKDNGRRTLYSSLGPLRRLVPGWPKAEIWEADAYSFYDMKFGCSCDCESYCCDDERRFFKLVKDRMNTNDLPPIAQNLLDHVVTELKEPSGASMAFQKRYIRQFEHSPLLERAGMVTRLLCDLGSALPSFT
jgi:hypothetical protein